MAYRQRLVELKSPLSFGKYKGVPVAEIYSGNPSKIVSCYQELLKVAFEHIFSKGHFVTTPDTIDLSAIGERLMFKRFMILAPLSTEARLAISN